MTDIVQFGEMVPVPGTGEIVDMADPVSVARALDTLRDFKRQVADIEEMLADRLRQERATQGTRQLNYDGVEVKFGADSFAVYDAEALEYRLRDAGMPEDRISEIIVATVERKVRAVEAKKAAAVNPAYAEAVELSREVVEKRQSVTVEVAR